VEFLSGCTHVIDPYGQVRYANRQARRQRRIERRGELKAMKGPLKRFWQKVRQPVPTGYRNVLRRLHD
jgi:hypothetical protein